MGANPRRRRPDFSAYAIIVQEDLNDSEQSWFNGDYHSHQGAEQLLAANVMCEKKKKRMSNFGF